MHEQTEKLRAAYALNLCTVSVSQIVDYNDINVLEQEYENILNNLNLEQMPKDEPLLDILTKILDTITFFRISEGDKEMIDAEYQHKMKNAVWSAIPSIGGIFVGRDPVTIGLTLATQVGIGYMNYRRNRAEYQQSRDREYWQLKRSAIDQLNGLQKELFTTAWRLAREYNFPDEYRLTERQIHEYNEILMEPNAIKRYNRLDSIRNQFSAYPHFWYQIGSTANSIYRSEAFDLTTEVKALYRNHAVECFRRYSELNQFNILRHDILTSAWALEYIDILDIKNSQEKEQAKKLVSIAERHAGNAKDVLELCAYAYLKLGDNSVAARIFKLLVNADYNADINAKILSGIYILNSRNAETRAEAIAEYQMLSLTTNPSYLLPMPAPTEEWKPEWENTNTEGETVPDDSSSFEEIFLQKIIHIPPEKTQQYRNKIIHVQSFINCEGTLEFDTCVIHYGEEGYAGVIDLGKNAAISMKHCTIENHSYRKSYFVEAKNQNKTHFSSCEFINCCHFINANGVLTLDRCQIISPGEDFVSAYLADVSIAGCKFKLQSTPEFFPEKGRGDIISAKRITFTENEVKGSFSLSSLENMKKVDLVGQYNFLRMSSGIVKNSSFLNFSSQLSGSYSEAVSIALCTFDNCYSCIDGFVRIEDCVFNECSKIITAAQKGSQITNCQFNDCFDQIISSGYDGGITLEFCEFNNWRSSNPRDTVMYSLGMPDPSMLLFKRSRKDGQRSIIQRCIFNGAAAYQSFLIEGDIYEKVKGMAVSVENCFFANCTTERQSGKIIKEYAHYYGRFNAKKEQQVVTISNCQGLDRINKESSKNTEVVVKTKNSVGATIGVGAAFAVAGVPGYVVASLIKKATTDDDIHIE